jgi:predicted DNA-binding transcriptional regulator AlpA
MTRRARPSGTIIAKRNKHPKHKSKKASVARPVMAISPSARLNETSLVPGPKLRAMLGISAVTLWRWRHDKSSAFPAAKQINGRLYFPWGAVSDWIAKQPEAA